MGWWDDHKFDDKHPLGRLHFWCQKVLPLVYDDSLSYYELLCKVVEYYNNMAKQLNIVIDEGFFPNFAGEWDEGQAQYVGYPKYTIVYYNGDSYVSTQDVPPGIEIGNTDYWQKMTNVSQANDYVIVTPEQYGAVGDGVKDDTEAIQACIIDNPNSIIAFRKPIYKVTDTIHIWGAVGGQMLLLGGSNIVYDGEDSTSGIKPVFLVERQPLGHKPLTEGHQRVPCTIMGGQIDANNKADIAIESRDFYTNITFCKIKDAKKHGIFIGFADNSDAYSTGNKVEFCYIYRHAGGWAEYEGACGIGIQSSDNRITGCIIDRYEHAYHLMTTGNHFDNCHSTITFQKAEADLTEPEFEKGGHILLDPPNGAYHGINVFNSCYFNVGHHVIKNPTNSYSRLVTNFYASHYTYYRTANLPFFAKLRLYVGMPSIISVCDMDLVCGQNSVFYDYFPNVSPTINSVPKTLSFLPTSFLSGKPIMHAANLMAHDKPEIAVTNGNNIPMTGQAYEVGRILLTYEEYEEMAVRFTQPFTIEYGGEGFYCKGTYYFRNVGTGDDAHMEPVAMEESVVTAPSVAKLYLDKRPQKLIMPNVVPYIDAQQVAHYEREYMYYRVILLSNSTQFNDHRRFLRIDTKGHYNKVYISPVTSETRITMPEEYTQLFTRSGSTTLTDAKAYTDTQLANYVPKSDLPLSIANGGSGQTDTIVVELPAESLLKCTSEAGVRVIHWGPIYFIDGRITITDATADASGGLVRVIQDNANIPLARMRRGFVAVNQTQGTVIQLVGSSNSILFRASDINVGDSIAFNITID